MKKLLKKWWFWVIVGIIVIGAAISNEPNDSPETVLSGNTGQVASFPSPPESQSQLPNESATPTNSSDPTATATPIEPNKSTSIETPSVTATTAEKSTSPSPPVVVPSPTPSQAGSENAKEGKTVATISRVIDGDTVELSTGEKVRLIGIDTPESVHPDKDKNTEYGKVASAYSKERLDRKTVYLEKDVSETDRYGRLLRYLYLEDGTFYNEQIVKDGYANVSTYPPDVKYKDVFVEAERYARENNKGLWAYDEAEEVVPATPTATPKVVISNTPVATPSSTPKSTPTPTPSPTSSSTPKASETPEPSPIPDYTFSTDINFEHVDASGNGTIKGNLSSSGEKIYHMPWGQYYDRTDAEYYFKTEAEAQAAGFRKSKR